MVNEYISYGGLEHKPVPARNELTPTSGATMFKTIAITDESGLSAGFSITTKKYLHGRSG